jgi:ABC-type transport system involved in cytochrome bd biosynthesis fused ATPase/permease subunit
MVAYHPYSVPVFTYVAFGSQGLPAKMPIPVSTLLAAIAVMAGSQLFISPGVNTRAVKREAAELDRRNPPNHATTDHAVSTIGNEVANLDLGFRRRLPGFELNVSWRTNARRLAILGSSGSGKS